MPEVPTEPRATARSPFAGCAILIVALLVMLFLIGFTTYVLFAQYREIEKFTAAEPVPVPLEELEDREPELNSLAERLEAFRQQLERPAPEDDEELVESRLALDKDDLNLAIAVYPALSELRGTFHVEEIGDRTMRIAISFLMNGKPRMAGPDEEGWVTADHRYLNGVLVVEPFLMQGEIALRIHSIEASNGVEVPDGFRELMSPYRITETYLEDEVLGRAMSLLSAVELENGRLLLVHRPGERPAGVADEAEVGRAAKRLFLALAAAAVVFLLFAATVLFIGLRAQKRREAAGG